MTVRKLVLAVALPGLFLAACGDDESVTKLTTRITALEAKSAAAVADAIKKSNDRIKALEAKVGGSPVAGDLAKAQDRIKALEAQNTAMAKQLKSMEAASPALVKSVSDVRATTKDAMAKLAGRLASLEKRAGAVSTDLAKKTSMLDSRMSGVSKDLTALKASTGGIAAIDKRLTGDIDALGKKLDTLRGRIAKVEKSGASASTVSELTRDVDRAREDLATMTKALSALSARIAKLERAAQ